jgi:PAS domain-containing protein
MTVPKSPATPSSGAGLSLRAKLDEAEQALAAIRAGEVDALVVVVGGSAGERVFTLQGAESGYRILLEALSEGVATLTEQGLITYCNARFAAIVGAPLERTIGAPIAGLLLVADPAQASRVVLGWSDLSSSRHRGGMAFRSRASMPLVSARVREQRRRISLGFAGRQSRRMTVIRREAFSL